MAKAKPAPNSVRIEPPNELSRLAAKEAYEKKGVNVGMVAAIAMADEITRLTEQIEAMNAGLPIPRPRVLKIKLGGS
ncbi:hypothetical protein [Anatilimnocola floriformis]|uniref:hypothetical protein n=1 Tax=Anatilimnocola floriformis TaxID=2948575 RepID=UPI0020C2C5BA|nr:hypothetical protein [Anatilimnocola floriformis]